MNVMVNVTETRDQRSNDVDFDVTVTFFSTDFKLKCKQIPSDAWQVRNILAFF